MPKPAGSIPGSSELRSDMDDKRNGSADYRDERSGAYDPVNEAGKPQPNQVPEAITPRRANKNGGDVRLPPVVQPAIVLPEGLRRPPRGPVAAIEAPSAIRTLKRPAAQRNMLRTASRFPNWSMTARRPASSSMS